MRNRPHRLVAAACGSLLLALPATALAQQNTAAPPAAAKPADTRPLPTAEAIHAKMIDFMGGREAFAEIGPVRSVGTFSIPSMQMTGGMRTFSAPPNSMRVEVDMPGVGSSLTVFDGTVGWSLDPFGLSTTQAVMQSLMGFDAWFFTRVPDGVVDAGKKRQELEFVWRASSSLPDAQAPIVCYPR